MYLNQFVEQIKSIVEFCYKLATIYKRKFNSYYDKSIFVCRDKLSNLTKCHRNMNSIRNKFDVIMEKIQGNIDLLMIAKVKLDNTFPRGHFHIGGSGLPIKIDRNQKWWRDYALRLEKNTYKIATFTNNSIRSVLR